MIISTKGRYGLRAMFVLARDMEKGPLSIKHIAAEQSISEMYLEQLFSRLRQSGLVKSIRGAQGGYMLARPPEEITVGSILAALEGPLIPADCAIDGGGCGKEGQCSTRAIWRRIYEGITEVVDSITLQDILNDYESDNFVIDKENCR